MTTSIDHQQLADRRRQLDKLGNILRTLAISLPEEERQVEKWGATVNELRRLTEEFSLPITIVGPVKSGKSTLINAIIGAAILPMGAGITTTFLTAVRHGDQLEYRLELLPFDQADALFKNSCYCLFTAELEKAAISLASEADRRQIADLLAAFARTGSLTRQGSFNEHYRLLQNLLAGYDQVAPLYDRQQLSCAFDRDQADEFRRFITDEALSTYLEQAKISYPFTILPPYVVLQDCQGLDTPSPGQQAITIHQLASSPVLVYVISSRMGLRQADYLLLEHLRELGLAERLLFVFNCDLLEHDDAADLERLLARCRRELAELGFTQPSFPVSALYHLYGRLRENRPLNRAEEQRWQLWQHDREKLAISEAAMTGFLDRLRQLGEEGADQALLHHLSGRMRHMVNRALSLLGSRRRQLQSLQRQTATTVSDFSASREKLQQVEQQINSSLQTIAGQLEKKYFRRLESWFNQPDPAGIRPQLEAVIRDYEAPDDLLPEKSRNPLLPVKVLEHHFARTVQPRLMEKLEIGSRQLWDELERQLQADFTTECEPLFFLLQKATAQEITAEERLNLPAPINWAARLPAFSFSTPVSERFAPVSKFTLLGQIVVDKLKRLRQRQSWPESIVARLRQKTAVELKSRLLDYQEQLKFRFLRPYLEEYQQLLNEFFRDFLHYSCLELGDRQNSLEEENQQRQELLRVLDSLENELRQLREELPGGRPETGSR
ncbi:MAG: dynamin family protein [Deltaproteobacteria bacterium]|nr:dynamin family protein [Deltaproteobacteria bacterium]